MKTSRSVLCLVFAVALAMSLAAQTPPPATGTITGRVFNAANNAALRNARVMIEGTQRETLTDDGGAFLLEGVMPGEVRVRVSYVGMAAQTATLTVPAGGNVEREFDLRLGAEAGTPKPADETVKLDAFTVVADQEMSAQAVALNERRSAPNIKQVVAFDEYGDRGGEDIGEFLRFLPGVGVTDGGQLAGNLSLRGFPSENTNIQLDGADISNARGNSRSQSLLDIPMVNVERVEISKAPTPDSPASGMGGSVNLITKTAFSARKPVFNYHTYFILDSKDFNLHGAHTLAPGLSFRFKQPSFDLSYILPINKKFGLTFGASRTWRAQPMNRDPNTDTQPDWNFTNNVIRQTTWFSLAELFTTWGAQMGADWKISDKDTLSASAQHRYVSNYIMRESVIFNFGAGVTGTPAVSNGAATAVGIVQYGAGPQQETGTDTTHATVKYAHKERDWKLEAFGSVSLQESFLDDIDDGFFNGMASNISGLILHGEGRGENDAPIHVRYSATTKTGDPVDVYDGGNVILGNPSSSQNHIYAKKYTGRVDLTREFEGKWPFTLKAGGFIERMNRRAESQAKTWTFTPPTLPGLTATQSKQAKYYPVFDEDYLKTAPTIFGHPTRFISPVKYYQLFQNHPDWFPVNEVTTYDNRAAATREITETVSAAYLRADAHFFNRRLWAVGGVRFEKTKDDGTGLLTDPTAIYKKDAGGNYILTNGARTLITTDLLEQAKLTRVINGAHVAKDYSDFYPSLNLTYYITDKLLLRGAAYVTIGRPNLNFITPGTTITDSTSANPTITVNNTALKPQEAKSFEFSLESYQIKGGQGSIGVFQKNINNFFGAVTQAATPELLAFYGLPNDPLYLNYDITTRTNAGDAKIIGYELGYKQSLLFLPPWARGLTVFVNATKLTLSGSNTVDFTGYAPETFAGGIDFVRPRFYVKLSANYQAETRNTLVAVSAANGIPPDTYNWFGKNQRVSLSASYSFTKHLAVYGSISHLNGRWDIVNRQYPPGAPDYEKDRRRQELGAIITLGLKGEF